MKALSIRQPWAQLIIEGHKDIENRSRPCKYRGLLVIHASKRFDYDGYYYLKDKGISLPPRHSFVVCALLGTVRVVDCVRESDSEWFHGPFGYVLKDPDEWEKPIQTKGHQGFFRV